MTRKQRMLAAIRRQPVDRVPYCTYNCHPYTKTPHTADPTYARILEFVRTKAGTMAKVGAGDVLAPGLTRAREGLSEVRIEGAGDARTRTITVHTPKGDLSTIYQLPENKPGYTVKPFITSDSDVEKYLSIPYEPPVFDLSAHRAFYQACGEGGVLMATYTDPMYSVAGLFDFEDFSVRCVTDLPLIERMIAWSFERVMENMKRYIRLFEGMDVVFHTSGPEVCCPPMLAPRFFGKLVTPNLRPIVDLIHQSGHLAAVHCHGRVREVLPHILDIGIDLLEPVEPPDQGNITLAELMDEAAGRMAYMGYIQDQEFYTAPPGHFTRRVEEIARVVNGRTGYIMCPTCTPFARPCPPVYERNYMEWLEAGERILGG